MQTTANQPDLKHLVLLGGGHAQISVLKSMIMNPIEGLRITLVSRDVMTPYSGMLPGYLEGQYHEDDITIDLSHLARLAGARFILATAESIDPDAKMIMIKDRPPLSYDVLIFEEHLLKIEVVFVLMSSMTYFRVHYLTHLKNLS